MTAGPRDAVQRNGVLQKSRIVAKGEGVSFAVERGDYCKNLCSIPEGEGLREKVRKDRTSVF